MTSKFKALKMPPDLADVADIRAKELGYPSWASYVKFLVALDGVCRSRHTVTIPWSQLTLHEQDMLFSVILRRVREGKGMTSKQAATWDWRSEQPQR